VALFTVLGVLYILGRLLTPAPRPGSRPTTRQPVRLGSVSVVWVVLLALAPSATWCVMPLLFAGLHALPPRLALPLAAVLTALVVVSEVRGADGTLNPNMIVAPSAVAAVATAVLVQLQRQGARQRVLIDDLVRTRHDLAATERRAGVPTERRRPAAEIHDTLGQGLSSQRMLLQASERVWRTDPDTAGVHLHDAARITSLSLAEARRFVQDLAPADLADQTLPDAHAHLAGRESGPGLTVEFRLGGDPDRLPERGEAALSCTAQGAPADVREHAAATRAALTLTFLDDQVSLGIAGNGRGLDVAGPRAASVPHSPEEPDRTRGHGLPAMRIRARQSGGTLTVESAPGEGTVVSAAVPLTPLAAGHPSAQRPVRGARPASTPVSAPPVRQLLCDDHAVVRAGLRPAVQRRGHRGGR
jgi:signal transduction histidine kinase